jgi:hypothetical protein
MSSYGASVARSLLLKRVGVSVILWLTAVSAPAVFAQQQTPLPEVDQPGVMDNLQEELFATVVRLPFAAGLGAVLALRPRRRGTPVRQPAVVQTQVILAIVGALIMLVIGSSLARAFGIVGAANLIRYRSKIDDPKDAVVMLCTLSVGLAAGVGLYILAVVGTAFLTLALWIIEAFSRSRASSSSPSSSVTRLTNCGRASRQSCGASRPDTSCAARRTTRCHTW